METMGLPVGTSGEEPVCPCRRCKRRMHMLSHSVVSDSLQIHGL